MRRILFACVVLGVAASSAQSADTHRTETELLGTSGDGLLPLNITGAISPQDLRDSVYSAIRNDEQRVLRADTIADLRAIDLDKFTVEDDAIAFVSGYLAAGDHSGVHYRYDADSTDADTAGTVLVPDAGSGRWHVAYPDPGRVDIRYFGAQADAPRDGCGAGDFDNATAFDRAEASDVLGLYLPEGEYCTSTPFTPPGNVIGDGPAVSLVTALPSFVGSVVVTKGGDATEKHVFDSFGVNANGLAIPAFGIVDGGPHGDDTISVHRNMQYSGTSGDEYVVRVDQFGATGSIFINVIVTQNSGGRLIFLGNGADDILWIGTRLTMGSSGDNGPDGPPVRIEGLNNRFMNTFVAVYKYKDSNTSNGKSVFHVKVTRPMVFDGLFIEVPGGRTSDLDYFFTSDGIENFTVRNLFFSNSGTADTLNGIVRVRRGSQTCCSMSHLEVRNIADNGAWAADAVVGLLNLNATAGTQEHTVSLYGVDGYELVVADADAVTSAGELRIELVGAWRDVLLNHLVSTDGTNVTITHAEPLIAANDNIDLIGANADVGRVICPPGGGTIQRIETVLDAALATGDATVTVAIAGVNVTGGVVTITQSGSAAGDVDSATPTALNDCDEGDVITSTVGGSSTAGDGNVYLHIAPTFDS